MTGKDLVLQVKVKLNKLDTSFNRALRPEMALVFLNDSYRKLVKAKYRKDGQQDPTTFQGNQEITDELNHLTSVLEMDVLGGESGSDFYVNVSDIPDYDTHLGSRIRTVSGNITKWINSPRIVTVDELGTVLEDPFNLPTFNDPIIYFEDNKIKFPASDFSINKYKITYLKNPEDITLDGTVLAPFTDDIVDSAVTSILESWESQRTQSKIGVDKLLDSK